MSQCLGEVAVDLLGVEVAGQPGQAPDKDLQLLQVTGGSTDPVVIEASKLKQRHGVVPPREGLFTPSDHFCNSPENRYNRYFRAASSVGYLPVLVVFWLRVDPILRAVYLALLVVCLWAHRWELCLGLLVAGQFGEALKEFRPRTG